jgi:transposase
LGASAKSSRYCKLFHSMRYFWLMRTFREESVVIK